jgi:hypothetical protein
MAAENKEAEAMAYVDRVLADNEMTEWVGADGELCSYGPMKKRACNRCRKMFDWDGNDYKKACPECYKKNVRKCAACKVNNLRLDAKPFETVCVACFTAKKSQTHGTCPTCPPARANHLRRPLEKDRCVECESRLVSYNKSKTV